MPAADSIGQPFRTDMAALPEAMSMRRDSPMRPLAWLAFLALVYYLPGLLSPRDFFVADEARYAQVLREMIGDGHWIVPWLDGRYYSDKPPLYFWLTALISRAARTIAPFDFLLVTWIAALGSLAAAYLLGVEAIGRRPALIGALLLMSSFCFLLCAQIVRMDMLMNFFITLSIYFFYRGFSWRQPAQYYLFYVFAALAVLAKGPLGAVIPFLPPVCLLIQRKRWEELRRFVCHAGFLVFLLMVGGWLMAAWGTGQRQFVRSVFVEQIAGRAIQSDIQRQPFWFYLALLPFLALPWSGFVIRAAPSAFRTAHDGVALLVWWFIAGFIVISALSGKLFLYVLPLLPPLFLMTGAFLDSLWEKTEQPKPAFPVGGSATVALAFCLVGLAPLAAPRFPILEGAALWPLPAVFLPLGALAALFGLGRRLKGVLFTGIVGMGLLSLYVWQVLAPETKDRCSARLIGRDIAERAKNGRRVATFRVRRGILSFYAGTQLPELSAPELNDYLRAPLHDVVMPEKQFQLARAWLDSRSEALAAYYIVDGRYVIVARNAAAEESPISMRLPR